MTDSKNARPLPVPTSITRPFWEAVRERRLVIQYDPDAKAYQFYPRAVSVTTGKRNLEWREVSGKGSVFSYTVTHVPPAGFEDKAPYVIASIDLDEGVRMLTHIVDADPDTLRCDHPVRVRWVRHPDDADQERPRHLPCFAIEEQ